MNTNLNLDVIEELPTTKFEGLGNDFIGRCDDWEWTEC